MSSKTYSDGNVASVRVNDGVKVPPLFAHTITNLVCLDLWMFGRKGNDRGRRVSENVEFRDFRFDHLGNILCCANDCTAGFQVAATMMTLCNVQCERRSVTYSVPIYCNAAQVPAIKAPGLRKREYIRQCWVTAGK